MRRVLPLATAIVAATMLFPSIGSGQRNAQTDPIDVKLSRKGTIVRAWVKRPTGDPAAAQLFEDYFDKYYFPAMTQTTPEALGELGTLRYNLFRQYLLPAAGDIQEKLTEKTFEFSKRVIRGKYHRSAKYNAVLLLGQLAESYSNDGQKPLPAANKLLCQILVYASDKNKKLPPYMLAGSLVALDRHAKNLDKLPQANQEITFTALTKATKEESSPEGVGPLTRDWLRRRAASSLAEAAKRVNKPEAVKRLVESLVDESLSLDTRAAIAASLEGLQLPADGSAATAVLKLADEVGKDEAAEASEFEELQIGGRRSREAMGLIQSERFRYSMEESKVVYVREGLIARLNNLLAGLRAVAPAAGDQAEATRKATDAVELTIESATDEESVGLQIATELRAMAATLAAATPGVESEPAAEEAVDESNIF